MSSAILVDPIINVMIKLIMAELMNLLFSISVITFISNKSIYIEYPTMAIIEEKILFLTMLDMELFGKRGLTSFVMRFIIS